MSGTHLLKPECFLCRLQKIRLFSCADYSCFAVYVFGEHTLGVGRESQTQGFQHLRASLEQNRSSVFFKGSSTVVPGFPRSID